MTPSRAVVAGSALPLIVLLGVAGGPALQGAAGRPGAARAVPVDDQPVAPVDDQADQADRADRADRADEVIEVERLRRAVRAGRRLSFTGTEVVTVWSPDGPTTRVLDLEQRPGRARRVTVRSTDGGSVGGSDPDSAAGSVVPRDGLPALSDRTLAILAAGHRLTAAGVEPVAGRAADVVVVSRGGREVARIWLDRTTGLLLRHDVRDGSGRRHRTAAFVELHLTGAAAEAVGPADVDGSVEALAGVGTPSVADSAGEPVSPPGEPVGPAELASLRAAGWPAPTSLPAGFVLLDARRPAGPPDGSVLHLTYGDGLSAISVFVQPGRLAPDGPPGLESRTWGDGEVFVRRGWPAVLVWQGGRHVITAVGEASPEALEGVLRSLPRQPEGGTLDFWPHGVESATAWLRD